MSQIRVHIDFETYSDVDIKKVGGAAYARHPSTRLLMAAWAFEDSDIRQWDATDGSPMPDELWQILDNREDKYLCVAQNANFEIMITLWCLARRYKLFSGVTFPPTILRHWLKNWRCTMVMGMGLSLPGSLGEQGAILKLDAKLLKMKEGPRLIRKFCMPNKPTKANPSGLWTPSNAPADWQLFLAYNRQDVEAERANYNKLVRYNSMPAIEWGMWHLDQLINLTGLTIDRDLVSSALRIDGEIQGILIDRFKEVTGLENPNSTAQLLPWLQERGYPYGDLRKDNLNKALSGANSTMTQECIQALKLRQSTSKTSNKKYVTLDLAAPEGQLRGIFQYGGAQRTRRWAGRLFQPQNLPRGIFKTPEQMQTAIDLVKHCDASTIANLYGIDNVADVLSSLIRNCVIPSREDRVLTVADLASIETVMTWWAAGATEQMDKVRRGVDAYKDYGTSLLDKDYDEITKAERTYCKPVVLGCCYRLGGPGLQNYAEAMGVAMTKKEAYRAVDVYRQANPEVVALWDKLERAFKECLVSGETQYVDNKFRFRLKKPCLFIDLPSGRSLCYVMPAIRPMKLTYEDRETGKEVSKIQPTITYMGVDQFTRKWTRQSTHGGKLLENLIQAIARDVLRDGLLAMASKPGFGNVFHIVGHVHDEILLDTPDDPKYKTMLQDAMTNSSPWCADAPLGSSAFQSKFYMKD